MTYEIIGAKGKLGDINKTIEKIKDLNEKHDVTIQLFDAELVYGREHLESAVFHAQRAMSANTNVANSIGMEILLYASGERQINLAIQKMGIKETTKDFGMVVYGLLKSSAKESHSEKIDLIINELNLVREDPVLEGDKSVLERFGIPEAELEAVAESHWRNLILERVAMVDIIK